MAQERHIYKKGATSQLVRLFALGTVGSGSAALTGLTNATGSLVCYYIRDGDTTPTQIILSAGAVGTWSSGGFKEISATNMPGEYELGIPNAVLASGSNNATIVLSGANNMAPSILEIALVNVEYNDSNFGLINLDAAVSTRSVYAGSDTSGTTTLLTRVPGTVQPQTGDSFARLGSAGAGLTSIGDTRLANLDAAVGSRSTFAGGAVASVTADVGITQAAADKVWNSTIRTLTAFSTVLATSVWDVLLSSIGTSSSIGLKLKNWVIGSDNKVLLSTDAQTGVILPTVTTLTDAPVDETGVTTLLSRITSSRSGYLDNLNVGGLIASHADVSNIQNNTLCVRVVPDTIERPSTGTLIYRIELLLYDEQGNMATPDSNPTMSLVNQSGSDRSVRLNSTTMALVSTGRFRATYTSSSSDTDEQLIWTFTVIVSSITRLYGNSSIIVDTLATDFTSSDRSQLQAIYDKLPAKAHMTGTDNSTSAIEMSSATGNFPGSVASMTGDVQGKVLGGGASVIGGVGAEADVRLLLGYPIVLDSNNLPSVNVSAFGGTFVTPGDFVADITRLKKALTPTTGSVDDSSTTASSFITTLPSDVDDFYRGNILIFTSGPLSGQSSCLIDYNGTTKRVTSLLPYTSGPLTGDTFTLVPVSKGLEVFLDKLGSDGKILLSADPQVGVIIPTITNLTNSSPGVVDLLRNSLALLAVPETIEVPVSGEILYNIELFLYTVDGSIAIADTNPTVHVTDTFGTDLDSRLVSITMTSVSPGRYRTFYRSVAGDNISQLVWIFTTIVNGRTRIFGKSTFMLRDSLLVFDQSDRTKLDEIHSKIPSRPYLIGTTDSTGKYIG